jgi:hypothetical protein
MMAMIVFSSPATLTGLENKKTGPSRFIADFQDDVAGWVLESGYRRLGRRQITIDTRGQLSYSPMTLKRGHAVQD